MAKKKIFPQKPSLTRVGSEHVISFNFDCLQETSYTKCKDVDFFRKLFKQMKELSKCSWRQIDTSRRHSYGYEKISVSELRKNHDAIKELETLYSFRATCDNHVLLGFREGDVLHVIFIESQFGDIYNHGTK